MKRKLLITVYCLIMVLSMSAQDTLQVNFKPAGTPGDVTWDSILVADKTIYDEGYTIYNVFGTSVLVKPVWLNSPVADNVRATDRTHGDFQYTGKYSQVLRSHIAVDSRYDNDCNIIGIEIIGLPEGTYTFQSYHHDFNDQHGKFTVATSINGNVIDEVTDARMISHSMDSAEFNARYPDNKLDPMEAIEFQEHYVTNSLDSVTKYTFNQIVSSGVSDLILVSFKNVLPPASDMSHYVKFVVINGFQLYETIINSIENKTLNAISVYPNPASEILKIDFQSRIEDEVSLSIIDITGKTVLENTSELMDRHLDIDISQLPQGAYLLKLSMKEEQIVRKFVIM
jgi:hypothetical protein